MARLQSSSMGWMWNVQEVQQVKNLNEIFQGRFIMSGTTYCQSAMISGNLLHNIGTIVLFYKAIPPAMKKWHYKRHGQSWGGDNLIVIYCLSSSDIWPVMKGGLLEVPCCTVFWKCFWKIAISFNNHNFYKKIWLLSLKCHLHITCITTVYWFEIIWL